MHSITEKDCGRHDDQRCGTHNFYGRYSILDDDDNQPGDDGSTETIRLPPVLVPALAAHRVSGRCNRRLDTDSKEEAKESCTAFHDYDSFLFVLSHCAIHQLSERTNSVQRHR